MTSVRKFDKLLSSTSIADSTDTTKTISLDVSGVSTGTNRTLTVPNSDFVITGNDLSQTLTNKTITASSNDVAANSLKSATSLVDVSSATAPTSGQILTATSSTAATWQTPSSGSADLDFQEARATNQISANITSFADMPNMSLVTSNSSSREYLVIFMCEHETSNGGRTVEIILNINGTDQTDSERMIETPRSNRYAMASISYRTSSLASGVTIKIRYRTTASTTLRILNRSLIIYGIA